MIKKSAPWVLAAIALVSPPSVDAAELWGNILSSDAWDSPRDNYGVYSFQSSADNFGFKLLKHKSSMNVNGGGTYFDGKHYWINWESYGMGNWYADDYADDWRNVDGNYFFDETVVPWDIAYNPKDGLVYGIFNSGTEISTLDFATMKTSPVTTINTGFPAVAIAVNKDGVPYWIDSQGSCSFWNTQYGFGFAQQVVRSGVRVSEKAQSAAFDDETGLLYWAATLEDGTTALYSLNVADKTCEKVVDFPNNEYVVSLRVVNDAVASGAPARVSDLAAAFEGSSLSGSISFTLPVKSIDGNLLDGTLDYTLGVNGEERVKASGNPGDKVSHELELPEGMANISVVASNAQGAGQEAKTSLYIGNDTPEAPSKVALAENDGKLVLTWNAPGATGSHGGYVDAESVTYTVVRYPGEVTVADGISTTAFEEAVPDAPLTTYYYNVYAVAAGKQSMPGRSGSLVAGNALEVPWMETFATRDGFSMFDVIDVAGDWSTWMWMSQGMARCSNSYYTDNDDWLVTPPVHLKSDRTYVVGFMTSVEEAYMPQRLTVLWGDADKDATEYVDEVMPLTELDNEEWVRHSATIRAPKDGDYKIAFHCTSPSGYYSLSLKDVGIDEGALLSAPGACSEVTAVAGAKGAMEARIAFNAPSVTVGGDALASISRIEVISGGRIVDGVDSPECGRSYSVVDSDPLEGFNSYVVVAYAGDVKGSETAVKCYVGTDTPSPVSDIRLIDNGDGSATLRWDAVSETGANGGYVNPSDVTYSVYTSGNALVKEGITGLTYDIPSVEQTSEPSSVIYRLTAANAKGESAMKRSTVMLLGPSAGLPFADSFAGGTPSQHWFLESPNSMYSFRATTLMAQDGDLGANAWRSGAAGEEAWVASAKITAKGAANPVLTFWYHAYPGTPNGLGVYLSCAGKEIRHLATVDYSALDGDAGWRKMVLPLSDAASLDYVSIRFKGFAGEENANIVIDNILVADMPGNDFGVRMSAPVRARRGRPVGIPVTVANNGSRDKAPFTLKVTVNGNVAAEISGSFDSGEERVYTVDYTPNLADGDALAVVTSVVSENDEVADNDVTPQAMIEVVPVDGLAAVNDLSAIVSGNDVHLSWSAPANVEGGTFTESFEHCEPWATASLGDWTTVDADGFRTFGIYDVEWPGKMEPHAFIVFNPLLATGLTGEEEEFMPHSGSQFLACFDADPEEPANVGDVRNDDWLISPQLSGAAQTVSFYARSLDPYMTPETFEVLASSAGSALSDFDVTLGRRTADRSGWALYTFDLPEGTQHFAIHVVSVNCYALFVDDITYESASATVGSYNVYRDGALVGNTAVPSFIDRAAADGDHTYFVGVCYDRGESGASNEVVLSSSGIDGVVSGDKIADADIFSLTGIKVGRGLDDLDRLPAGVYIMGGRKIRIK
ncbi:choice-of-anchor J domain-containing protein [uncultured Muribaculum sp.]|uniref:choice-of-anchor J domain-containing protein n=1 Tax=uncultured Muribaculum sp. TaxID=1918613 RepID=UPI0025FC7CEF|nr:choice-of-anchor J domain-containing protein [uncultured Muribaculum sp.]